MRVFVKNKRGEALMPCSVRKARLLLKQQKAIIVGYQPFAIQLTIATGETVQELHVGVDTGVKHLGIAVISEDKIFAHGEIEFRQDVSSLLETRKTYRRSRRNRNTRYRRCKYKFNTKRVFDKKKKKWIKPSISLTSKRPEGWLPPSLENRIQHTFRWVDTFTKLLPHPKLHLEVGKFDVQKMMNPLIQGKEYQEGETFSYHEVRYYVFARDHYTCQVCKKKNKILNTHHIIYRSHKGSDRADNLITVCTDCHTHENHQEGAILWTWMMAKKKVKQYKEPPFMHVLRKRIFSRYPEARITYGSETTPHRKTLALEKSHQNDAIAIIGISKINEHPCSHFRIVQFRKKKRSLHEATARKGRKEPNCLQKRNAKNTKESLGFLLNDQVCIHGQRGFITGFTGPYVQTIEGKYITLPGKSYKQVPLRELRRMAHHNNWQYTIQIETRPIHAPPIKDGELRAIC